MKGLVASDVKLIKMMDKSLEVGTSSIIPVGITKERKYIKKRFQCGNKRAV